MLNCVCRMQSNWIFPCCPDYPLCIASNVYLAHIRLYIYIWHIYSVRSAIVHTRSNRCARSCVCVCSNTWLRVHKKNTFFSLPQRGANVCVCGGKMADVMRPCSRLHALRMCLRVFQACAHIRTNGYSREPHTMFPNIIIIIILPEEHNTQHKKNTHTISYGHSSHAVYAWNTLYANWWVVIMMARESVCFMRKLRQLCQYVHNTRARICHRRRRRCIRAFVKALRVCEINIFCFQSIYARYPTTICTYCTYHIRIAVFFGWRTPSCLCSLTLAQHEIVRLLVVCVWCVASARAALGPR